MLELAYPAEPPTPVLLHCIAGLTVKTVKVWDSFED